MAERSIPLCEGGADSAFWPHTGKMPAARSIRSEKKGTFIGTNFQCNRERASIISESFAIKPPSAERLRSGPHRGIAEGCLGLRLSPADRSAVSATPAIRENKWEAGAQGSLLQFHDAALREGA